MSTRLLSGIGLLLALLAFVSVNILANNTLTSWRLDLTEHRLFTLSQGTKNILAELGEPITLRYYFSQELLAGVPELTGYGNRVRDMLEEYVAHANGKLNLRVVDPEPFSEAEDLAVAYGLHQLPFSSSGEVAYLGLVGSNTVDDEIVIPFFQPSQEESLEYDLTKLVYDLANPKKRVIGVMSSLPLFGDPMAAMNPLGPQTAQPWTIVTVLREHFEVRQVAAGETTIPADVDTLLVIHPKGLDPATLLAIDQFVLAGGKLMLFVDPFAENDVAERDPTNPLAMPQMESNLPDLLKAWGLELAPHKIVGDYQTAIRVAFGGERGRQEAEFLPWLALTTEYLNRDDFVTSQLNVVNVGSSGALRRIEDPPQDLTVTPLITSSDQAMLLEADAVRFNRDPASLLNQFQPDGIRHWLAVRVTGNARTAFPNGPPVAKDAAEEEFQDDDAAEAAVEAETETSGEAPEILESRQPVNVIIVADSDLLADQFWVQNRRFLGIDVPQAFADNGDFLINAVDNLGGNSDLISLRSRGSFTRPFDRVDDLRRAAEAQFRDKEQALLAKLTETEDKIRTLQQQRQDEGGGMLLTKQQQDEIERFRKEQLKTRKELRAVQHDLRKNIEGLGTVLKFVNIGLIPLLIGFFAIGLGIYRMTRRPAQP